MIKCDFVTSLWSENISNGCRLQNHSLSLKISRDKKTARVQGSSACISIQYVEFALPSVPTWQAGGENIGKCLLSPAQNETKKCLSASTVNTLQVRTGQLSSLFLSSLQMKIDNNCYNQIQSQQTIESLPVQSLVGFILNGRRPSQWDIRRGVGRFISLDGMQTGWMKCGLAVWFYGFISHVK